MQKESKNRKKIAPILCAAIVIGILAIYLAILAVPMIEAAYGEALVIGFVLVYGGLILAAIFGVITALRQRLQEIESGEEEDAKQY